MCRLLGPSAPGTASASRHCGSRIHTIRINVLSWMQRWDSGEVLFFNFLIVFRPDARLFCQDGAACERRADPAHAMYEHALPCASA